MGFNEMSIDQGLLEAAEQRLENSICEYNDRYGYLGANWDDDVQAAHESGQAIGFRVYFDDLTVSLDIYFENDEWYPDGYLWRVAEEALRFSIPLAQNGELKDPLPEYIELD